MPAEWEEHGGTWLSWPKHKDSFPGKVLERVEDIYLQIIRTLQKYEKVFLLVNDIKNKLIPAENVIFYNIKTVDIWTRDYAPIFVRNEKGEAAAIKWVFNAWGNKYEDLLADNDAGKKIAEASGVKVFYPDIVLEGGSIDTNGKGTLLTTEQCLLNKNRNPHLSKKQIEGYLRNYLGVEDIIWLKGEIPGDDTDGHIDNIVRFVNEDTIVYVCKENQKLLKNKKFNIIPLPIPGRVVSSKGIRLPASYANFYIANRVVLAPVFNDKNDKIAIKILQDLFKDREVIPIYCTPLLHGYGAIHCATQQQPRGV